MKIISYTITIIVSAAVGYTLNNIVSPSHTTPSDIQHQEFTLDEVRPYQPRPPLTYTLNNLREKHQEAKAATRHMLNFYVSSETEDLFRLLEYSEEQKETYLMTAAKASLHQFTRNFNMSASVEVRSFEDNADIKAFHGEDYEMVKEFYRSLSSRRLMNRWAYTLDPSLASSTKESLIHLVSSANSNADTSRLYESDIPLFIRTITRKDIQNLATRNALLLQEAQPLISDKQSKSLANYLDETTRDMEYQLNQREAQF